MAYQVLARKYRPQLFADVAGQDHVTRTLLNALAQNRIAHGYIFSGHRGIGKTTVARILAMALNCRSTIGSAERPTPEPCSTCIACTEIRAGNAVDVIEIDAATNRGIDEIRELREAARYSPARDRYKIYILDEAHQITDAAFNALLKTLEEPPAHVVFMMATTQPEDFPQTIRSRCQHFSFHAVRFEVIRQQLEQIAHKEGIVTDAASLSLLAEAGDGSMRDALSILDQAIASAALNDGKISLDAAQVRALMGSISNAVFEQMLGAVQEQNSAALLEQAAVLLDAGNAPQQIARQMVRFLRNCLMARIAGENSDLLQISEEEKARAQRVAALFSEEDLTRFLNSMLRTFDDLGYRQEQRFHLELGLLKLVYTQRLLPLDDILRRLGSGAANAAGAAAPRASHAAPQPAMAMPRPSLAPAARTLQPDAIAPSLSTVVEAAPVVPTLHAVAEKISPAPVMPSGNAAPSANEARATEIPRAEQVRGLVCTALAEGGHSTLATLLEEGAWRWEGRNLCVQAAAGKVMLEMAYTSEAQRIARERFRSLVPAGCNLQVTHEARAASTSAEAQQPKAAPQRATSASAPTVDHPLVQSAQKLFNAEIRSVVNLRERS